jgi:glycosyltransferase involved in cell wall biosynthesis
MLEAVERQHLEFEVVLCENGSSDGTCEVADDVARRDGRVRVEHLPEANYGLALKHGLRACRHDAVVIFNIDFWSAEFARAALDALRTSDLVIGSKMMGGSRDERPLLRRLITRAFNSFLRTVFGFLGTDTHGMKALRRSSFGHILDACVTEHWIFDTELVLRGERAGRRITEIPVVVREVRAPSYGSLLKRIPTVLWNLVRLVGALRSS